MGVFKLAGLDPRTKVVMMAALSTAIMAVDDLAALAVVLACTVVTLALGGVKASAAWNQLRGILAIIVLLFLVQSVFTRGGEVLLYVGTFPLVTEAGFHLACVLCFRFAVILLSALILLTGESRDYLLAMVQCKLPYELAFMVMAGIHFLPILRDEALNVYYAVQLRGTELEKAGLRGKIATYRRICLPILTGALRRSKATAGAMELRGFRSTPNRTYMRHITLKARDYFFLILYPCIAAAVIVLL